MNFTTQAQSIRSLTLSRTMMNCLQAFRVRICRNGWPLPCWKTTFFDERKVRASGVNISREICFSTAFRGYHLAATITRVHVLRSRRRITDREQVTFSSRAPASRQVTLSRTLYVTVTNTACKLSSLIMTRDVQKITPQRRYKPVGQFQNECIFFGYGAWRSFGFVYN